MKIKIKLGSVTHTFLVLKDKATIGSDPKCDIVIEESNIERVHAVVSREDGDYFITHYCFRNAVTIHGRKIEPGQKQRFTTFAPMQLKEGVVVQLDGASLEMTAA